ncbi:membrane protein [Comamonas phosphati]|nr:membrane protein [Comamonas phosphati]
MLFRRLIWTSLFIALVVGSLQAVLQHRLAVPIILAAEVFEEGASSQTTVPLPLHDEHPHGAEQAGHAPLLATPHEHEHAEATQEWTPANGHERAFWTWVATVLNTLALALLALAAMATSLLATIRRGDQPARALPLGISVAVMGWFSLHLWPTLGLPAELPGMEAAALSARQGWWLWAAVSALGACALLALSRKSWRWPLAALLLALPFLVGAPQLAGDPLGAFGPEAQTQMRALQARFGVVTHLLAATQWLGIGWLGGWLFGRWVQPFLTLSALRDPAVALHRQTP